MGLNSLCETVFVTSSVNVLEAATRVREVGARSYFEMNFNLESVWSRNEFLGILTKIN